MKKTLIALALAATAVSGSAMAWTPNGQGGTMEFGGTITPQPTDVTWMWKLGAGKTDFNAQLSDLTNDGKKLSITNATDMPLLLGKLEHAFVGRVGIAPNIEFTGYDNVAITPEWSGEEGSGTLTLPVKSGDGAKMGTFVMPVQGVGGLLWALSDGTGGAQSRHASGTSGAFKGGTGSWASTPAMDAMDVIFKKFGTNDFNDLDAQLRAFPGLSNIAPDLSNIAGSTTAPLDQTNYVYTGTYALGVPAGKIIDVNFTNSVTTNTEWKAPLTIKISYI
ncbi:hypothetical protein LF005_004537 [Salmonella enterica]|nr:hypothetical protein [Salmonella enterica subsp. enterica serovar Kintambo]ECS5446109.1 hypothetical protein [Salmonella enterica subsp. enterica serovar Kintambo]EHD3481336.1 hypothetical protein [Salmonella enterica]EIF8130287.1 hypothetical protein [Salmonella enterica]EKA2292635.1 hypothetical protein [Salmonella enterica]